MPPYLTREDDVRLYRPLAIGVSQSRDAAVDGCAIGGKQHVVFRSPPVVTGALVGSCLHEGRAMKVSSEGELARMPVIVNAAGMGQAGESAPVAVVGGAGVLEWAEQGIAAEIGPQVPSIVP